MLRGVRAKAHCYSSDVGSYTSKAHYYITHYYIYPLLIVIYSSRHLGRVCSWRSPAIVCIIQVARVLQLRLLPDGSRVPLPRL